MPRLSRDQISTAVHQQLEDSEGFDKDELASMRRDALDYYFNRDRVAPTAEGRSSLQSSDVADMLEAVVAQMMPAYEGDSVAQFEPVGEDDVDQARAESNAVEWCVMQQNNGHYEIQQAVRDALLLRNGIIKVYLEEKENVETTRYEMLTVLEYGDLMRNAVSDLKTTDNGYTVKTLAETDGFYDVKVVSKHIDRKVCTRAVDPGNFSWERDYDSIYLDDCRFVAERSLPTRSDLINRGYPKSIVSGLNAGSTGASIDSRSQHSQRSHWQGATPAADVLEVFECHMRLDADGDGLTELLRVVVCDKTILEVEEVQYIPYASGTPFLQPHRFTGLSLFDKLRFIQDQKTFGVRQWADNLNNANNARVAVVDGQVNIDDVVNSRPGGVIRTTMPGAIEPVPFTDVGPSVQQFMDYADKMRSERGGASLDMQAAELQIAGDTAHGVERQMTAKEQMAAMMCRTIAETLLRSTWQLVHKALRLYIPDEIEFRVSDQFVRANPGEWQERKTVTVKSGLSNAERGRKGMALSAVVQRQDMMMQQGAFVSPADVYNAQLDWARSQGLDDPERYFTDPNSEEAQQAQQQQQQQAQQQQEYQNMLLELQQSIEDRKADNADAKVIEDQRQFDQELQYKYWESGMSLELEEAKVTTDTAIKMVNNERGSEQSKVDSRQSVSRGVAG